MPIVLQSIEKLPEPNMYRLDLLIDGEPATYKSSFVADLGCGGCDEELFFLLSNRSMSEVGT